MTEPPAAGSRKRRAMNPFQASWVVAPPTSSLPFLTVRSLSLVQEQERHLRAGASPSDAFLPAICVDVEVDAVSRSCQFHRGPRPNRDENDRAKAVGSGWTVRITAVQRLAHLPLVLSANQRRTSRPGDDGDDACKQAEHRGNTCSFHLKPRVCRASSIWTAFFAGPECGDTRRSASARGRLILFTSRTQGSASSIVLARARCVPRRCRRAGPTWSRSSPRSPSGRRRRRRAGCSRDCATSDHSRCSATGRRRPC